MTNCPWGWPQREQWRKRSQLWWKQGHGRAIMFDLTLLMWLGQSCSDRIKARLSPMGPIRQMRTICACSSCPFVQSRWGQIVKGPGMVVAVVLEERGSINMIKSAKLKLIKHVPLLKRSYAAAFLTKIKLNVLEDFQGQSCREHIRILTHVLMVGNPL